jgi:hypothetical protein
MACAQDKPAAWALTPSGAAAGRLTPTSVRAGIALALKVLLVAGPALLGVLALYAAVRP